MDAFYFGEAPVQLLGVYHAPAPDRDCLQGIVLCYPFGQEYMRAHRAFRQLAESLASAGYHVLRFDYRGSGDSSGDMEGVTAEDWLVDIGWALRELRDMTGVQAVSLLGLRLGGLLAGIYAARSGEVSRLLLWDPFVSGKDCLDDFHRELQSADARKQQSNFVGKGGEIHFNGFSMPAAFQRSLQALDLRGEHVDCAQILHLASHENEQFESLRAIWSSQDNYEYQLRPSEHDWNYIDHIGGILLPQAALRGIREWM